MISKNRGKKRPVLIALAVIILTGAVHVPVSVFAENKEADDTPSAGRVVVSMGDSYSSGEGLGDYGKAENTEKPDDPDWLARRSDHAWPGQLTVPGIGTLAEKHGEAWYFVASSGARTRHFRAGQVIRFLQTDGGDAASGGDIPFHISPNLTGKAGIRVLDPQLSVFSKIPEGSVSYVTLTIGGNDLGFTDILASCALTSSSVLPDVLPGMLEEAWNRFENGTAGEKPIREQIKDTYREILSSAGEEAVLIVAGYPVLLDLNVDNGLFEPYEAQLIDRYARKLDEALSGLVSEYRSENAGAMICYVSAVDAFEGHGAYAADPYVNGIIFEENDEILDHSPISAASFHPNGKGAAVYRMLVQAAIDEWEAAYPYYAGSGRIEKGAAYAALTSYADTYYGADDGSAVLFYDLGMDGAEYRFRLRKYDGLYENYYVDAKTGELFEACRMEEPYGIFGERRPVGTLEGAGSEEGGSSKGQQIFEAVVRYVRDKYDPALYPDISGYLRYEESTDRYVCRLELPEGGWRWVTLRADDGKIFDLGRDLFSLSGQAADYLQGGDGNAGECEALMEDLPRDGEGSDAGFCGISRYDIDGDGSEEILLYVPRDGSTGLVYVYYIRENRPVSAGRITVPAASRGGLYIYKLGIITADGGTGSMQYHMLKYYHLTRKKNWEGSGLKTAFDCINFYGIYHDEIEITPRFREYAAAGEG